MPARWIRLEPVTDEGKNDLELGIVGGVGVGQGTVLCIGGLCFVPFMNK